MKDPAKALKESYLSLLIGNLTYNGSPVPVYDEESDPAGSDFYVIVSSVNVAQNDIKSRFHHDSEIIIDVVTRFDYRLTKMKEVADVITAQVIDLVLPSPDSTGLTNTDFQFNTVKVLSSNHLPVLDSGTKKVLRRITRFSHIIVEK